MAQAKRRTCTPTSATIPGAPTMAETPVVRDVDGVLVIDWPHPRPVEFTIEALVVLANIGKERERDG